LQPVHFHLVLDQPAPPIGPRDLKAERLRH
jgi:hypothetical protein